MAVRHRACAKRDNVCGFRAFRAANAAVPYARRQGMNKDDLIVVTGAARARSRSGETAHRHAVSCMSMAGFLYLYVVSEEPVPRSFSVQVRTGGALP